MAKAFNSLTQMLPALVDVEKVSQFKEIQAPHTMGHFFMNSLDPNFLALFIDTPVYCIDRELESAQANNDTFSTELIFEGKNKKHTVMLISYSGESFLTSLEGGLLLKICGAVSLKLDDIALININENHAFDKQLDDFMPYKQLISFGVNWPLAEISQQDTLYKAFTRNDKKILKAESLTKLGENVASKRALWKELKLFFG